MDSRSAYLVHQYFEGCLDAQLQAELLAELPHNAALREEFELQRALVYAARTDAASIQPSKDDRTTIFARLQPEYALPSAQHSIHGATAALRLASAKAARLCTVQNLRATLVSMAAAAVMAVFPHSAETTSVFQPFVAEAEQQTSFTTSNKVNSPDEKNTEKTANERNNTERNNTKSDNTVSESTTPPLANTFTMFAFVPESSAVDSTDALQHNDTNGEISPDDTATSNTTTSFVDMLPVLQTQRLPVQSLSAECIRIPKRSAFALPDNDNISVALRNTHVVNDDGASREWGIPTQMAFSVMYGWTEQDAVSLEVSGEVIRPTLRSSSSEQSRAASSMRGMLSASVLYRRTLTELQFGFCTPFVQAGFGATDTNASVRGLVGVNIPVASWITTEFSVETMQVMSASRPFLPNVTFGYGVRIRL